MEPNSRIEIDLSRLDANLAAWRTALGPGCEVCPVIKADGYGLGALPIAQRLAHNRVPLAAVYSQQQARAIFEGLPGINTALLILMPVELIDRTDRLYRPLVTGRLHLTVHSRQQLARVNELGVAFGTRIPIHVEVDTGMARLGMSVEDADALLAGLGRFRNVRLAGLFSHASSPLNDPHYTSGQLEKFEALTARHASLLGDGVAVHFSGTGAAMRDRRHHMSMARIGIGLLGYYDTPEPVEPMIENPPRLQPVMRWVSRVVHLHTLPTGASVGYDRTFVTKRPTRLGIVSVGYADGYPLALSNRAIMRVGAGLHEAPVVGRGNMDQCAIDLTDAPESDSGLGAEVEVYSDDPAAPNALPKLAALAGTLSHELLCRLSTNVTRRYSAIPRKPEPAAMAQKPIGEVVVNPGLVTA